MAPVGEPVKGMQSLFRYTLGFNGEKNYDFLGHSLGQSQLTVQHHIFALYQTLTYINIKNSISHNNKHIKCTK